MNRNMFIILVLLSIVALVFYLVKGRPGDQGFDLSDRQFKIENVKDIAVLSIERKDYPAVVFTKKGNTWYLNNGKEARPEATNYLFSILANLKIKYIPSDLASKNLKESIAKNGIHVRAYDNSENLMKSFYIGPDVGNGTGTGFLMEGATQPYVMFASNYYGSIRTRFVFDMNEYETKNIFAEPLENIEQVEVKYPYDKPSSYTIVKKALGYDIFNPYTNTKLPKVNDKLIEPYLANYASVVAEYNDANNSNKEMIMQQPIFSEITLKSKGGKIRKATLYSLPNIEFHESKFSPKEVSPDTRFMVATDNNEFYLIQHRVIGKILTSFDAFALR
jgi:hypothetical protein